ncbi:MAG TPA: hypothetical protein VMD31_15675 [Opitutaceae bacterium]|nr:hypothetical protein [Opitutaceae bacterium]
MYDRYDEVFEPAALKLPWLPPAIAKKMSTYNRMAVLFRPYPFLTGGLAYAFVCGSCDPNYWGSHSWLYDLRDLLELPFFLWVRVLPLGCGALSGGVDMVALVLNVFAWGCAVSVVWTAIKKPRVQT